MSNIGTTNDGKPVQGPWVGPATPLGPGQNVDGDLVTVSGTCTAVNGVDNTGTATVQLKRSLVSVTLPMADVRGHRAHAIPVVGDNTVSTGKVTAVSGSGPTAQLTVQLTNSGATTTVSAEDVTASQSL
jgi:hypothetical protein